MTSGEQPTAAKGDQLSDAGLVDASRAAIWEDDVGAFHMRLDDEETNDVRAVRTFPLSGKADYISLVDDKGKEVALIGNPRDLDEASLACLERSLKRMYYVARIVEVLKISETMGISKWHVMTDRGYANFEILARDNIRESPKGRFIIVDADGNRFEIPDVTQLDDKSQSIVSSET